MFFHEPARTTLATTYLASLPGIFLASAQPTPCAACFTAAVQECRVDLTKKRAYVGIVRTTPCCSAAPATSEIFMTSRFEHATDLAWKLGPDELAQLETIVGTSRATR